MSTLGIIVILLTVKFIAYSNFCRKRVHADTYSWLHCACMEKKNFKKLFNIASSQYNNKWHLSRSFSKRISSNNYARWFWFHWKWLHSTVSKNVNGICCSLMWKLTGMESVYFTVIRVLGTKSHVQHALDSSQHIQRSRWHLFVKVLL